MINGSNARVGKMADDNRRTDAMIDRRAKRRSWPGIGFVLGSRHESALACAVFVIVEVTLLPAMHEHPAITGFAEIAVIVFFVVACLGAPKVTSALYAILALCAWVCFRVGLDRLGAFDLSGKLSPQTSVEVAICMLLMCITGSRIALGAWRARALRNNDRWNGG